MEKSSLKKSKKRSQNIAPAEIFQIVGENDNDDNLDLEWLEKVDFKDIEDYNPNHQDGFKTCCEQKVPTLVQLDPDSTENMLHDYVVLTFKIMVKGGEKMPLAIKLEVTSEDDVQFYYQSSIMMEDYGRLMTDNELIISYIQFIPMMKKLLEDVIEKQDSC